MTAEPAADKLTFRRVRDGAFPVTAMVTAVGPTVPAGEFLLAREITLDDDGPRRMRQVLVADGPERADGYDRLDNEILAGRLLHDVTAAAGYPATLSRLYGDEASSACPYALLEPYLGDPADEAVRTLTDDELDTFEASLLTGLCWLDAAGLAHRGLSPRTVRCDRLGQAQITDFSLCTLFGVPRQAIGTLDWAAVEQRPGSQDGVVTNRDDMYAAGRLIFHMRSRGERLIDRGQLAAERLEYLNPLFDRADRRPTARELLASRFGQADPVPRGAGENPRLAEGYRRFDFWSRRKSRPRPDD